LGFIESFWHGHRALSVAWRTYTVENLGIDKRGMRSRIDLGQRAQQAGEH